MDNIELPQIPIGTKIDDKFRVIKILGEGHFATVYLVLDLRNNTFKAMKVPKNTKYPSMIVDEAAVLMKLKINGPHQNIIKIFNFITYRKWNKTLRVWYKYKCIIMELLGESVYEYTTNMSVLKKTNSYFYTIYQLTKDYDNYTSASPISMNIYLQKIYQAIESFEGEDYVKIFHDKIMNLFSKITTNDQTHDLACIKKILLCVLAAINFSDFHQMYKDMSSALRFLENLQIIHTDIKPENILIGLTPEEQNNFGVKNWSRELLGECPCELLDVKKTETYFVLADFGNSTTPLQSNGFNYSTYQYRGPEIVLKTPYSSEENITCKADIWSVAACLFELFVDEYLFDPIETDGISRNENHAYLITELLGEYPNTVMIKNAETNYYTVRNNQVCMRNIKKIDSWLLLDVLKEKYYVPDDIAEEICDILLPMLCIDPHNRTI